MRKWLERLDEGKGRIMRFLEPLCKEFGDLRQVAACVVPGTGTGDGGALSRVDPVFFEVLGVESLGLRLILAKGLVDLEVELAKKPPARAKGKAGPSRGSSASSRSEAERRTRRARQAMRAEPDLRGTQTASPQTAPPPGVWSLPPAALGGGGAMGCGGAMGLPPWRTFDPRMQGVFPPPPPQGPWAAVPPPGNLPPPPPAPPAAVPQSSEAPPQMAPPPGRPFSAFQSSRPTRPPPDPPRPMGSPPGGGNPPEAPAPPRKPDPATDFDTKEAAFHALIELSSTLWHDNRGSVYELTLDAGGTRMAVKTKRADGRVVVTKNLIHLDPPQDGAGARIAWGIKPSFVLKNPRVAPGAPMPTASWIAFEANRTPFEWWRGEKTTGEAEGWRGEKTGEAEWWCGEKTGEAEKIHH